MNFAAEQQQADPSRELYKIYQRFCAFGKGHRLTAQQLSMDSRTFQKYFKVFEHYHKKIFGHAINGPIISLVDMDIAVKKKITGLNKK